MSLTDVQRDRIRTTAEGLGTDFGNHVLCLLADLERAEAERDRWYQTAQNEVQRASDDRQNLEAHLARVVDLCEGWGHALGCDRRSTGATNAECTCGLSKALAAAKEER